MLDARQMPGTDAPIDIRNRMAVAGWVFMATWLAFLVAMTWVLTRDGPHPSQPAWVQQGAIALFWLVGIPLAGHLLAEPCTRLVVAPDGSASLHRRSLLTRKVETFPPGSLAVEVRPGKDGEGDPIWRTLILAADGRERLVQEGPAREEQDALATRLRAALRPG